MSDIDLASKFPDMRPLKKVPSLVFINGCGTTVYGTRDYDDETGTYVTTHCFCLLLVPVVALGAYRVARDGPTWFFLGRVPLSTFARLWNSLVFGALLLAVGLVGWHFYSDTPEYRAGRRLAEADRAAA